MKCLRVAEVVYVMVEIHEGWYDQHSCHKTLARKILRVGYYWLTIETDTISYVWRYEMYQKCVDIPHAPANEFHNLASPWTFIWWRIDMLGPFPRAPRQVKYMVVAVNYFTKWIKVETLVTITSKNVENFVFRKIIWRFKILNIIVTDNDTQLIGRQFRQLLSRLNIKQRFTSIENPQTNNQVKVPN